MKFQVLKYFLIDSVLMCFYDQSQQRSVYASWTQNHQVILDAVACSLVSPVTVVNTIYAIIVEEAWKTNSGLQQASYAIA